MNDLDREALHEQQCGTLAQHIGMLTSILYDIYEPCEGIVMSPAIYWGRGRPEILVSFMRAGYGFRMMDAEYLKYKINGAWLTFDDIMALEDKKVKS